MSFKDATAVVTGGGRIRRVGGIENPRIIHRCRRHMLDTHIEVIHEHRCGWVQGRRWGRSRRVRPHDRGPKIRGNIECAQIRIRIQIRERGLGDAARGGTHAH